MFGAVDEVREGIMHQHIVSKAIAYKRVYWIFHTRGEDAVSVLLTDLNKQIVAKSISHESVNKLITAITSTVAIKELQSYERIASTHVIAWGTGQPEAVLDDLVRAAKGSCVLGYEKTEN